VHQLAVVTVWEVEIANEHVSRIEFAIIVPVGGLSTTPAGLRVAATDLVVCVLGESATTTTKREVLIFAIVNAVVSLA
jgi:hypothetical protein